MGRCCGGLHDFLCNRPPGAVFLFSLLAFGMTTMGLSVYFGQNKNVPNPDALNWNTLLTEVGKLHFCLDKSNELTNRTFQDAVKTRNVSISVRMEKDWFDEYLDLLKDHVGDRDVIVARGRVRLSDMGRNVPYSFRRGEADVTFEIPTVRKSEDQTMCVNLEAAEGVLDVMNSAPFLPESCAFPSSNREEAFALTSVSGDHVPHSWCKTGAIFQMPFETQPAWTVLIDGADQAMIQLHLMVTSAFLFSVVGAVVAGIFIRGIFCKQNSAHKELKDFENYASESDN